MILQPEHIQLGIHRLPVPVPFPVEPVNVYFAAEPVPTLIDTSPKGRSFLRLVTRYLRMLGYSIADIRRVILTHPHFDHYGLAGDIVARSGAEIWAPAGTNRCFRVEAVEEEERFHHELLLRAEAPLPWIEYVERKFGGWARTYGCEITPTRYLEEGDQIEIGSGVFTVTPMPGHTPWCVLIHDPGQHIAFSGDFLLHNISSNPIVQPPDRVQEGYGSLKAFISSLRKTRAMGLQLVLPGHGRLIENPNERIDALLQFIEERKALVLDIVHLGPQTLFQMVEKLFPHLRRYELFLAASEVVGHLQVLEGEGKIIRKETDRKVFFE